MTPEEIQEKESQGHIYRYGVMWPPINGKPMLGADIEIWMYMNKDGVQASPEYKGQAFHMRAFISETMGYEGAYQPFVWNPNAIQMVDDYYENPWSGFVGHGSCVAHYTRIYNPVTGESPTIGELLLRQEAPIVQTLQGPIQASIPFIKGFGDLYEITTEDGQSFTATGPHKVLTPSGYVTCASLSVGDTILGCSDDPPHSTSGTAPSAQRQDAHHWQKRAGGSQGHYSTYPHPYGGQPHLAASISQSLLPSRGGALGHIQYMCCGSDVPNSRSPYNRSCLSSNHASKLRIALQRGRKGTLGPNPWPSGTYGWSDSLSPQLLGLYHSSKRLPRTSLVLDHDGSNSESCSDLSIQRDIAQCSWVKGKAVSRISKSHRAEYYDLMVPDANHYLAEGVIHHNSGKSRTVAAIAIAEFCMDPRNTSCLLTSTTIPEGKKRIWADVELCWHSVCTYYGGEKYMPGELVPSLSVIRYVDRQSGYEANNRGLALIPSKEEESKAGIGKMKGFKAPRLRMFLDEGSDISIKVVESAKENLITGAMVGPDGKKDFRASITLNANDRNDTGGKLCMPKGGWDKVDTANTKFWMSEEDVFVRRFSGWDSPNVLKALAGECGEWDEPYPGLLSLGLLKAQQERKGNDSPNLQRQYLAIWPVGGVVETIFTDDEIRQHGGNEKLARQGELVAVIWGMDPSFTHGGDRTPLVRIDLIRDPDNGNRMVAQYVETIWLDDGLDPRKSKSLQLREKFIEVAKNKNILPRNFGCDITGSGRELMSMINEKWPGGVGMEGITFNAKATDHPVSMLERTPAVEKYSNLGVELWMVGKELMMSGQIKNLPKSIMEEMCGRQYDTENKGKDPQGRVQIEDTPHYKKRLGRSPDEAQALFIALQVARTRYGLLAAAKAAKKVKEVASGTAPYDWTPLQNKSKGTRMKRLFAKFGNLRNTPTGVS